MKDLLSDLRLTLSFVWGLLQPPAPHLLPLHLQQHQAHLLETDAVMKWGRGPRLVNIIGPMLILLSFNMFECLHACIHVHIHMQIQF